MATTEREAHYYTAGQASPADDGYWLPTLSELVQLLWSHKWIIASAVIAGSVLGFGVSLLQDKVYVSRSELQLGVHQSRPIDQRSSADRDLQSDSAVDTEVEVIKSLGFIEGVIVNFRLHEFAELGGTEPRLAMAEPGGKVFDGPEEADTRRIAKTIARNLVVDRKGLTRIVSVSYSSQSPTVAAQVANAIADSYVERQLERQRNANEKSNSFLTDRLDRLRQDLLTAEREAEEYRARANLFSLAGTTAKDRELVLLTEKTVDLESELDRTRAKLAEVEAARKRGGDVSSMADVLDSRTIQSLREQQVDVKRRLAEYSVQFSDRHPSLVQARNELDEIDRQIAQEIDRVLQKIKNDVAQTEQRKAALADQVAALQTEVAQQQQAIITLRELETKATAARNVYEAFLNRLVELQNENLSDAYTTVLTRAVPANDISNPSKKLFLVAGASGGLVIAFAIIIGLEAMRVGFGTVIELERATGRKNLGVVLRHKPILPLPTGKTLAAHDYLVEKPNSFFAQNLFEIFNRLKREVAGTESPKGAVVLMTSAVQDEGKTTTTLCLAQAASLTGARVLVVEADIWHPTMAKKFGLEEASGFFCQLRAEDTPFVPSHCPGHDFDMIPVTKDCRKQVRVFEVGDLFSSERMGTFLKLARDKYDLVLIDAPPTLAVSAVSDLHQKADRTLFLIHHQHTRKDVVLQALSKLEEPTDSEPSKIKTILTQVSLEGSSSGGLQGAGYYKYVKEYFTS